MKTRKDITLELWTRVIEQGFDDSYITENHRSVRVKCTQCEAIVINHLATHERGCPNARRKTATANDDE